MLFGIVESDDLRVSRVGDCLADTDNHSQQEEDGEGMNQPGCCGCEGPHKITCGQQPVDVQPIHQPAIDGLETSVGPKECRQQEAQLRRADAELVLQQGGGDGEIAAVDVIDEDRDSNKDEKAHEWTSK